MREDVPRDTQGVYAGRPSFCPFAYRKPGHSAKQPLGWSSHEPHVSIAFRPIGDAETVGPLAAGLRRRECFGRSAGEGAARGLQRTRAAERLLRHDRSSRRGPSSPGRDRRADRAASWRGRDVRRLAAEDHADHSAALSPAGRWCRRLRRARRKQSRRSLLRYTRRHLEAYGVPWNFAGILLIGQPRAHRRSGCAPSHNTRDRPIRRESLHSRRRRVLRWSASD